jgi:glycosyltransferase involved in cell wall biosynthesis
MRILYITHRFFPETLAVERCLKQVLALRDLGHEISVLTSMPSYPRGRIFHGYEGRAFMRERVHGIDVYRVRAVPTSNSRSVIRLFSFVTFCVAASIVGLFLGRHDLVIAAIPSPGTELAGLVVTRLTGGRLLLELIDVLPDNLGIIGISGNSVIGRMLSAYYHVMYHAADLIAVICPSARDVVKDMGVSRDRILLLPNGVDPEIMAASTAEPAPDDLPGKFVVLYSGSFGPRYNVSQILDAAEILRSTHPEIHFLLLGGGGQWEKMDRRVRSLASGNVTLPGIVPWGQIARYLMRADLFIHSLVHHPMPRSYYGCVSAKACEYLGMGRPIITVEDGQVLAGLLDTIGAGMRVEPGNPDALAAAISLYSEDPALCRSAGQAGRDYAKKALCREKVIRDFEESLRLRLRRARS